MINEITPILLLFLDYGLALLFSRLLLASLFIDTGVSVDPVQVLVVHVAVDLDIAEGRLATNDVH